MEKMTVRDVILAVVEIVGMLALAYQLGCSPIRDASADPTPQPTITVHFSPHGGCTDAVVALIGSAKTSILVAGYSFTSEPIAQALVASKAHGVSVRAILDKSDAGPKAVKGAKAPELKAGGVLVWIDARHPIFHDKYIVVDDAIVETGSFNYTKQAEDGNAENCLVIRDAKLAAQYSDNWVEHWRHTAQF